jgi:methyl-accepting chemotaxis protein
MFNSINKKMIGVIALLLLCTVILGIVALWSVRRQGALLRNVAETAGEVMGQTAGLGEKLNEAAANAAEMGDMAAELGEQFKSMRQLIQDSNASARETQLENLSALAGTALQLLDRRVETAKFLADAAVKSRDVRESAAGFHYAAVEDAGGDPGIELKAGIDPYESLGVLNDFVGALVSSADANFYAVLGLKEPYRGKGLYSNEEAFFDADLSDSYLFEAAIRENRITKSIDRIGDDLALGAAAFLKTESGEDLGVLVCGYWFKLAMLRFLSDDLGARLALFVADADGKLGKARYSTFVDQNGDVLDDVPMDEGLADDFNRRLNGLKEKALNENQVLDGRSVRNEFLQVKEVGAGGLTYEIAYQGLLDDEGGLLGILAVARDITEMLAQQDEISAGSDSAIRNAQRIEMNRLTILTANERSRKESEALADSTRRATGELKETLTTASNVADKANIATLAALLGAVLIGVVLCFLVNRVITKPIKKVIDGLAQSAAQVSSASDQVSSASRSLAEGSSRQAASVEESSASLEEMASMTKVNADNAGEADHLMKQANQVVARANDSMDDLTGSMKEISKASEETSKIIKTIDEIAFQTNLLALNAAVEAARAGEAGAGFAVVAEEVRNLALRAGEAARNTADMIEGTIKKVKEGSDLVRKTGDEFTQVRENTTKVGELVASIATASGEQAQGIDQVSKAVSEMDSVTQQNAANSEESASASEEMNAQAGHLKGFVGELVALVGGGASTDAKKGRPRGRIRKRKKDRDSDGRENEALAIQHAGPPGVKTPHGRPKQVDPEQVIPLDEKDFDEF